MSKYFKDSEIECKCGCGFIKKSEDLISRLDTVREALGVPIVVTSWCRCPKHNAEVGGEPNSAHLKGLAVDLQAVTGRRKFILVMLLLAHGFKRIGIDKDFIHADIDETLPQSVLWIYQRR